MTEYAIKLTHYGRQAAKKNIPNFGSVKFDKVATFADLKGQVIRCTSGHLWVTLENDVMDHVLRADQAYTVPATGKVIIGGKGCYTLEPGTRMPQAS